jgi:hypothetical protein
LEWIERKLSRRIIIAETEPVNPSSTSTTSSTPQIPVANPALADLSVQVQHPLDEISLDSDKGVDYTKLRYLLRAEKWKEADQETLQVMLKAANRVREGWLDPHSLWNFPCKDLKTIDRLWVTGSNGYFGFSVQRKIWEECGSPSDSGKDWDCFCVKVGWKLKDWFMYTSLDYDSLKFGLSLFRKGTLPVGGKLVGGGFRVGVAWQGLLGDCGVRYVIFYRSKKCEL